MDCNKRLTKRNRQIYILLRAAGYGMREVSDLLNIPLCAVWRIERNTQKDIAIEADLLQLKQIAHEKENSAHN